MAFCPAVEMCVIHSPATRVTCLRLSLRLKDISAFSFEGEQSSLVGSKSATIMSLNSSSLPRAAEVILDDSIFERALESGILESVDGFGCFVGQKISRMKANGFE